MTITAYINDALKIRVHRFHDAVTPRQLTDLAQFYGQNPRFVRKDLVSFVDDDAIGEVAIAQQLHELRSLYRNLHVGSDLVLVRRSAWVCRNPRAWTLLEEWLSERHSRDGQGTEVVLVAELADATGMYEQDEIESIANWSGFRELFQSAAP